MLKTTDRMEVRVGDKFISNVTTFDEEPGALPAVDHRQQEEQMQWRGSLV